MFEVTTHATVADIPEWDLLHAPSNANLAAWRLRVSEVNFADVSHTYIAVRDAGVLIAVAPCWTIRHPNVLLPPLESRRLFARWQREGATVVKQLVSPLSDEQLFPYTVLGAPNGYVGELLVSRDATAEVRTVALAALFAAAADLAAHEKSTLLFLPYLDAEDTRDALAAAPRMIAAFGLTDCRMPSVTTFDAYLETLDYHRRRCVRQEIKRFEKAGLRIEVLPMSEVARRAPKLVEPAPSHGWAHSEYHRRGNDLLIEHADDKMRAFCAVRDDTILGFAKAIYDGRAYDMLTCRTDPDADKSAALYFNLGYYAPIRAAADAGVTSIHFGGGSLEVKYRRGCTLQPRWNVVLPIEPWSEATVDTFRACGDSMLAVDRETAAGFAPGEVDAVLGVDNLPLGLSS